VLYSPGGALMFILNGLSSDGSLSLGKSKFGTSDDVISGLPAKVIESKSNSAVGDLPCIPADPAPEPSPAPGPSSVSNVITVFDDSGTSWP
jgi:hypothetical protein